MTDNRLLPAAVFGGLLAIGFIGAGALIGQGVVLQDFQGRPTSSHG